MPTSFAAHAAKAGNHGPSTVASTSAGPEPSGRQSERERIREFVAELDAGRGGMVLITGPTGIGKTFLAHRVLQDLPPHIPTVTASPLGYLQTPGLWPVRQIIRALLRFAPDHLRQEFDRLTRPDEAGDLLQYVLVERIVDLLVSLSGPTPLVAVLDDLDRVDPLTVAVVEVLSERIHSCALLLLVCARSGGAEPFPVAETLDRLRGRPRVVTIRLDGLTDDVMERVVGTVRAEIDVEDRRRIARISAGNPLLAQELAHLWVAQQRIADAGGPAPSLPATSTLRELMAERLSSVDADDVLAPLAILGRPATLPLLTEASGVPPAVVQRIVERAAVMGVVSVDGTLGRVGMAHSVFTDVLLRRLPPDETRRIHLRLASLFDRPAELPGPRHVERARHLIAAGERTETTAGACLVAASYEENAGGHVAALELTGYGLDTCDAAPATRVQLLRLRGRCLSRMGEAAAARRQLLRAVETAQTTGDAVLFASAVADLTAVDDAGPDGDAGERIMLLEQAAHAVADLRFSPVRVLLLARLSELLHLSDPQRSRKLAKEALTAAGHDAAAVRQAYQAWALTAGGIEHVGDVERARSLLGARGQGPQADAFAVFLLPALTCGDRSAVDHYVARAREDADRRHGARARDLLSIARLSIAVSDADVRSVAELTAETVRSQIADVRMLSAVLQLFWQFHARGPAAPAGPSGGARATALPGVGTAPSAECADLLTVTRATMLALAGDREAGTWLRLRVGSGSMASTTRPGPVRDLAWAITALVGNVLADKGSCRSAVTHFDGHTDKFVTISTALIGPAGWFAAHAYSTLGERAGALQANEQALELSRRFTSRTWTAQCLLQRAQLLAQEDPAAAADLAKEAASLAESSQLSALAERAGQVQGSLQTPRYPLNPHQLELLRLAAKGLRNDQIAHRLYVSTATIERHLSQIYRILGVANRAAATRWLSLHGPESLMSPDPRTLPRPSTSR
jgi:DNA-binding CsgD family transcriptional regulator